MDLILPTAGRPALPADLLPRKEYLRIYLYELADAGHLSRAHADAIVDGHGKVPDSLPAPARAFIVAYLS